MSLKLLPGSLHVAKMYNNHHQYHEGDSGFDLFCVEGITIPPASQSNLINFQVKCKMVSDPGTSRERSSSYMLVPRSSISRTPLRMSNSVGIIDAGYRGFIMAKVDNLSPHPFDIKKGDRFFQLVRGDLEPFGMVIVDCLDDTTRGTGGFGSTD